jgi:competence protein ComEC
MDDVASPASRSGVIADRTSVAGTIGLEVSFTDTSAQASRRYQPLVIVTLAVAGGIIWDRYGPPHILSDVALTSGTGWFVASWLACAFCLAMWWLLWHRQHVRLAAFVLLFAAALAGAAWHELNWFLFDENEIGRYAAYEPAPVCIEAVASQSPVRISPPPPTPLRAIPVGERTRLLVDVTRIRDGRDWLPASGVCQITCEGHLLGIHPGDQLRVFGQVSRIALPLNPGEFDFAARARADGQFVRVRSSSPESVSTLSRGSDWRLTRIVDDLRVRAKQLIRGLVGPNRAGLAAAILLGAREGLPYEETESYLVTGTIHVLVVSGMNVAILATGLIALMHFGWLGRRTGLFLIMVIVATYAVLAELQPPVVRAAVLGVLVCVGLWLGRKSVSFNSLFVGGLIVLVINPNDLFTAGPQLSFLAVGALIWIGTWSERKAAEPDRLDQMIEASRPWAVRILKLAGWKLRFSC